MITNNRGCRPNKALVWEGGKGWDDVTPVNAPAGMALYVPYIVWVGGRYIPWWRTIHTVLYIYIQKLSMVVRIYIYF